MYTKFLEEINSFMAKEDIKLNEPMKNHTTFRVGGPARVFLTVHAEEILKKILGLLSDCKLPYFVLGNGSNLLVSDSGYDGVMVCLGEEFAQVEIDDNCMKAGAAAFLGKVARRALEAELTGLEFAAGIPGTIGGGVVMNAGAYGGELSQSITAVRVMDSRGNVRLIEKQDLQFGYRESLFKHQSFVILEVFLKLREGNREEIEDRMKEYTKARMEKQPLEYPSAGSTFKRPKGYFAGKLIMDAGLRGYRAGDAQISEKHCGFVINKGNATAQDIRKVIEDTRQRVKEKFGVELEPEVIILGE